MNTKTKNCDICHSPLENEWGNNAWPIIDGTCCDTCNGDVIVARVLQMQDKHEKAKMFISAILKKGELANG